MNILWDFDGTIFDTYPIIVDSFFKILQEEKTKEKEKIVLEKLKITVQHTFEYFDISYNKKNINFMKQDFNKTPLEKIKPFPYVEEILKLANKNFIVTHKDRQSTFNLLERYNLMHYFEDIICLEDAFERKPNPSSYIHLSNKNKIDLVIGDRELDLIPGKFIDATTCSYCNLDVKADIHTDNYKILKELLKE